MTIVKILPLYFQIVCSVSFPVPAPESPLLSCVCEGRSAGPSYNFSCFKGTKVDCVALISAPISFEILLLSFFFISFFLLSYSIKTFLLLFKLAQATDKSLLPRRLGADCMPLRTLASLVVCWCRPLTTAGSLRAWRVSRWQ